MEQLNAFADRLAGKTVYVDANPFIYLMEGYDAFSDALEILRALNLSGAMRMKTSELTLCEVLTKPIRDDNQALAARYRSLLEGPAVSLIPTTRSIYVAASELRARWGLKTPDAIHIASALDADCPVMLTQDYRLAAIDRLEVVFLPPNGA